jgi:hypothetical protein
LIFNKKDFDKLTKTEQEFVNRIFAKLELSRSKKKSKNRLSTTAEKILNQVFEKNKIEKASEICEGKVNQKYEKILEDKKILLSSDQIKGICNKIAKVNKKRQITGNKYPRILNQNDDCRMRLLLTGDEKKRRQAKEEKRSQPMHKEKIEQVELKEKSELPKERVMKQTKRLGYAPDKIIVDCFKKKKTQEICNNKKKRSHKLTNKNSKRKIKKSKYTKVESKIKHLIKLDKQIPKMKNDKVETQILIESN